MSFTEIPGGVTAARGFLAGSAFCGIKPGNLDRPDIALIYADGPAVAAGTFTTNRIKAAPVRVSLVHVRSPDVRAIVANSGNANACTGVAGIENAKRMAQAAAGALGLRDRQVLVCSTGRIGVPLPIEQMEGTIANLQNVCSGTGSTAAARAIMTSDTFAKEIAIEMEIEGSPVRIGGIAKGAGMIDPNMATMLCFLTTDAVIDRKLLQRALSVSVESSFNRITIDGDMSTNDTVLIVANSAAGHPPIRYGSAACKAFQLGLEHVTKHLARMIVEDGEGVTKFVEVKIQARPV